MDCFLFPVNKTIKQKKLKNLKTDLLQLFLSRPTCTGKIGCLIDALETKSSPKQDECAHCGN